MSEQRDLEEAKAIAALKERMREFYARFFKIPTSALVESDDPTYTYDPHPFEWPK